ncbi:sensor histidine kinase [Pseudogracilibacillus sp. SE30717A]|uniref:sensor histidine kinase n=1 Tax=Pseudogracilibacillus sp. SE30717A TaxID=3098293 RepID=UPI00300E6638
MSFGRKLKDVIQRNLLFSFKSTINVLYISLIILFVSITGIVSYFLAVKQIEENTYTNVNDTVLQTNNYLEFLLTDVFQQLVTLSNDPDITSFSLKEDISPKMYIQMDEDLKAIYYRYNSIIESIYVDIDHGNYTFSQSADLIVDRSFSYEDYYQEYSDSKEQFYWRNIHPNEIYANGGDVLSVFKLIGNETSPSNGIIVFNLRTSFFEEVLNKSLIGKSGYLTLISPDGSFESKHVDKPYRLDPSTLTYLSDMENKEGQFTFENSQGEQMIVIYHTIGVNKWKVAAVVPEREMLQKINYIKYFTILFVLFIILIATFLVNFVGKYISKPIEKLAHQMTTVEQNNLVPVKGLAVPDEMRILYKSFDKLIARNRKLLDQVKLEQEEKRKLEVAIIQAQINPHFLYNTLHSIKGLCDMGMNEDASRMVSALSSFFRISISKGNEIISVKEEIDHIKNYLFIMEMRYGDDFTYQIDLEEELNYFDMIKLTLQPLIENAIYHGVKQKRGQGYIDVRVYEKKNLIYLEVEDNGSGIDSEKLVKIKEELRAPFEERRKQYIGIGLRSVNERIKSYYGREYGLSIESDEYKTKITIIIPKVKEGNSDYA